MGFKQSVAKFWITSLLLVVILSAGHAQQTTMPPKTQDRPLKDRIASMERSERDAWQKPEEVVKVLNLKNGDVVADIGAGTGYFTRPLAKAVAPDGKVYAVDVAADILGYLRERAEQENLRNIVTIVSTEDDPKLPANTVDLAFFCDTTHHIANRVNFYRKMSTGMKPHSRLVIIDYPPGSPHAPHRPEQHVSQSLAISEAGEAGFKYVKEFKFLPYHYFLLFEKSSGLGESKNE
jgi:ubiquinone/menaquinone biosynthesis C-methylase UbiE